MHRQINSAIAVSCYFQWGSNQSLSPEIFWADLTQVSTSGWTKQLFILHCLHWLYQLWYIFRQPVYADTIRFEQLYVSMLIQNSVPPSIIYEYCLNLWLVNLLFSIKARTENTQIILSKFRKICFFLHVDTIWNGIWYKGNH